MPAPDRRLQLAWVLLAARWAAIVGGAAWALTRLFGWESGFPLVALIAYTPYVAIAALLLFALQLVVRDWDAAIAAAAVSALLVALVLPRALPASQPEPGAGPELRVLSANMKLGRANVEALLSLLEEVRPQFLSLQELTGVANRHLRRGGIDRILPYRVVAAAPRSEGGGLYSAFPLHDEVSDATAAGFTTPAAAVEVPGIGEIAVTTVHPPPPTGPQAVAEWTRQLQALPATAAEGPLRILAGDFNATLDHDELRQVLDRGYRDAADATGEGLTPTWPNGHSRSPPVTIDHVLADERLVVGDYAVLDLPDTDHSPVFAVLSLPD